MCKWVCIYLFIHEIAFRLFISRRIKINSSRDATLSSHPPTKINLSSFLFLTLSLCVWAPLMSFVWVACKTQGRGIKHYDKQHFMLLIWFYWFFHMPLAIPHPGPVNFSIHCLCVLHPCKDVHIRALIICSCIDIINPYSDSLSAQWANNQQKPVKVS